MKSAAIYFLFFTLSCNLFPQNILEDQFNYASSLFRDSRYFDSITEFKRLILFDSTGKFKSRADYFIGTAYKKGGFYIEAIKYLSDALYGTTDKDSLYTVKIGIIKCNILRRTTYRALVMLQELEDITSDSIHVKEINTLRGLAYAFKDDWESAAGYFESAGNQYFSEISREAYNDQYSETKAQIFSAILPGSGQFYTGNYLNGVVSLALNAATLYFTIDAFMSDRIFDGIIIGNFLWLRFYLGNIYNAGKFARENNAEIYNRTLKLMQEHTGYSLQ